jgi:hypothetical protein
MSALTLWIDIPLLMLAAAGIWIGAPVWLVLHHPKDKRGATARLLTRERAAAPQRPAPAYATRPGLATGRTDRLAA